MIKEVVDFMDLKLPYTIEIKSRKCKGADGKYWGLYSKGVLKKHLIYLYMGNSQSRSLEALIAHELIHAWQEEKGLKETHGVHFQDMAARIMVCPSLGIQGIYNELTDV